MRDQIGTVHTNRRQEKEMSNCTKLKHIWQIGIEKTRTVRDESNPDLVTVPIQHKISYNGFLKQQNQPMNQLEEISCVEGVAGTTEHMTRL